MSGFQKVAAGCGCVVALVALVFVGGVVWLASGPVSGVKLPHEMDDYALEYLEDHGLLDPSEELLAYYDYTLSMDGTEAAILTDQRVLYHRDGETEAVRLREITEIRHREEALIGDVIEVWGERGPRLKIEIAPFNQGQTFLGVLESTWGAIDDGAVEILQDIGDGGLDSIKNRVGNGKTGG